MTTDLKYSYPNHPDYYYTTMLRRVDLNAAMEKSLSENNGFIIRKHQGINKDIKEPDSIYSNRYGQTLQDLNPYRDRYRCRWGNLKSRLNDGIRCDICKEKVKYVDDNFKYFGWIVLKEPYEIIHPNLFKSLEAYIGSRYFNNIIENKDVKDKDGYSIQIEKPKNEPFYGIGLLNLKDHIDEILEYYKKPSKMAYYEDLVRNKNKIFIHAIPVYTTLLRPFTIENKKFNFEGTNKLYNMMCKYATEINNDSVKILRQRKAKNRLLYDLQMKYMQLYDEIEDICSSKKGTFRSAFGGRYDFTSRLVISPNPKLRIDEVELSYFAAVQLLEQTIMNVLCKSYFMSYSDAYSVWYKACIRKDPMVESIILNLISDSDRGIPILINRNPTIAFGSILQMFVVGLTDAYVMKLPLQILKLLAADFDGDVLNILYIVNHDFFVFANRILNPRNSMCISRNDGRMNDSINHNKDLVVNANTLMHIGREFYSKEEIKKINSLKYL